MAEHDALEGSGVSRLARSSNSSSRTASEPWWDPIVAGLRGWWTVHQPTVLGLAVMVMALLAVLKLGDELRRLVWDQGWTGAIDLKLFHVWVGDWFAGRPVYGDVEPAKYPPASFPILWLLLGWSSISVARWLWAATSVGALAWLALLLVRESGARSWLQRAFVALMLLSLNATGVAIGNGQIILLVLPFLLAGLLRLRQPAAGWRHDLLTATLILLSLVKPTISAPFFWLVLFGAGRLVPAIFVTLGYLGLTLVGASFQDTPILPLLATWQRQASANVVDYGYANVHSWLSDRGLETLTLPVSMITLLALGLWVYRHRKGELWVLVGVAALIARFWNFHMLYDDVLVVLPMITLFQIAQRGPRPDGAGVLAGLLLAASVVAMLLPARLSWAPWPWNAPFTIGHPLLWGAILLFLLERAEHQRSAVASAAA